MSFRGDDQRRYGHVPPVQYPVAGQAQSGTAPSHPDRRASFDTGDDTAFFDNTQPYRNPSRGEDELFLTSPTDSSSRANFASPNSSSSVYQQRTSLSSPSPYPPAPPTPTHATYNPQAFSRSQSTSLPYHPAPTSRYTAGSPTSPYGNPAATTSYTPAAYNPAAYAAAAAPQPQASYTGYGAGYPSQYASAQYGSPGASYGSFQSGFASPGLSYTQSLNIGSARPSVSSPGANTYDPAQPNTFSSPSYANSYSAPYGGQYGASSPNGASDSQAQFQSAAFQTGQTTPYPTYPLMPAGPDYPSHDQSPLYDNRTSRSNSHASAGASPQAQPAPLSGLHRHPTNAPLPSRPADDYFPDRLNWDSSGRPLHLDIAEEERHQDSIIQDIEELAGSGGSRHGRDRPTGVNTAQFSDDELERLRRYDSTATTNTTTNTDHRSETTLATDATYPNPSPSFTYGYDDEDSDPEGMAGVLAMKEAELDDHRFGGVGLTYSERPLSSAASTTPQGRTTRDEQASDSDLGGMDLGLFSGGFPGNLTYGNDVGSPPQTRPLPDPLNRTPSQSYEEKYGVPPSLPDIGMDYGGTGGLQAPTAHRLSYDDGEEQYSVHSRQSGSESPYKEDYPDIFYHPGLTNRPLPPIPPPSDTNPPVSAPPQQYQQPPASSGRLVPGHSYSLSVESRPRYPADDAESYYGVSTQTAQHVERSISLSSHSTTPVVHAPARSRTDAADERRKLAKTHSATASQSMYDYDPTGGAPPYDMITLPTGRRKKFVPAKLTSADFRRCAEPWALSGIAGWIREMAEGEPDLKQKSIEDGLVKLFTAKVVTMNVADAETLSAHVVREMLDSGILIPEEEWVKFGPGSISGVLWQLTGSGCYAPRLHEHEMRSRCYSHHCTRTLKKANLDDMLSEESIKQEDWATFYKLTKESIGGKHKKEIERQNVLHEIVTSEEVYMNQLEVLRVLYRDHLRNLNPPIIKPDKLEKFLNVVFGKVDVVQAANKDHLLAQLKYRQKEQGPWITGFSDIFREWIRKARVAYLDYASTYPYATYMVRREIKRNYLFRQFLDQVRNHKRSERLDWTHFLKTPITRLQRYTFLLGTVEKNILQDNDEKANIARAIQEIHTVTLECDQKVDEMQRKVEMMELNAMLVLRPGFQSMLNLDHLGRELILQGDLQRLGSKNFRWVDAHVLLFDHYLILAKIVSSKDGRGEKEYDVSKEPIPIPLLVLESQNEDPVSKQKGLTAPLTRTAPAAVSDTKLNKMVTNGSDRPGLEHTATSSSTNSAGGARLAPSLTNPEESGKILYPFKIKHLGHEVFTLYASSPQSRQEWCQKIIEAKTRHAKALHSQNAEPFRLRVLADASFAYDSVSAIGKNPGVPVSGTPLDRAIREIEEVYGAGRGPLPVCRAQVNCATGFSAFGKMIIAVGTDNGVYISDSSDPRGWQRTVSAPRVTQIAVLEEFSACLIISDRSLVSYPLDVVAPVSNFPPPAHGNPSRAPQKLAKDVSFFAAARMKERMLIFYKKKEGMHNTFFKVLEPVFQRSTEKKTRLFGSSRKGASGSTETFRDYDEFFFPADCFSLNLFQSYIAVATVKGYELLTLDKKQPMSIPDVKQPAIANIASRIRDLKPLGMFRLNDQEFLLTYENCAVYVDKHGDVSRTLIMEYSGKQKKAKSATLCGQYLVLFNEDYVEVRNAENGRLRQIISGRDVRCLDYGARGPTGMAPVSSSPTSPSPHYASRTTVKIAMTHPEIPGMQIALEMLLNDGHLE